MIRAPILACLLLAAPDAGAEGIRIRVSPDSLAPGEDSRWSAQITIENTLDGGLYLDSLVVVVADADSGETRAERGSRARLGLLQPTLSAGDSSTQSFGTPATCERGAMRVLAWGRDRDGARLAAEATVPLVPSRFSLDHPSRFFTSQGARCEYVLAMPDTLPAGGVPAVLLIHGHGGHARRFLPQLQGWSRKGYAAMAASQRGYGLSGGAADFMGPATVQALSDAVDLLRRQPGVDAKRIAVVGYSRGAACAVSLATRRDDLAAVVAQGGPYDLWATWRHTRIPGLRENIEAEAGRDSAAWRARTPLLDAERIRCPLLVLHGEADDRVPVGPARALHERLKALGRPVEARFFPGGGHFLPRGQAQAAVESFLERHLAGR